MKRYLLIILLSICCLMSLTLLIILNGPKPEVKKNILEVEITLPDIIKEVFILLEDIGSNFYYHRVGHPPYKYNTVTGIDELPARCIDYSFWFVYRWNEQFNHIGRAYFVIKTDPRTLTQIFNIIDYEFNDSYRGGIYLEPSNRKGIKTVSRCGNFIYNFEFVDVERKVIHPSGRYVQNHAWVIIETEQYKFLIDPTWYDTGEPFKNYLNVLY